MTVIVDTGCANLASVRFAIERIERSGTSAGTSAGTNVTISDDAETILSAQRVILPGVGAAPAAMAQLEQRRLLDVLPKIQQPLLGICLGMQLLGESSAEGNAAKDRTQLLGLLPITTERLDVGNQPLPHMGWNSLEPTDHPLFAGINKGDYVYFVHSYGVAEGELTLASSQYGGRLSAAVGRGNIMGVQFHPERSGKVGARILKNFLEIPA